MPPRDEETIENPPTEAAADSGARGPSARQLVGSALVLALVLGAGIAVGAATRTSSSASAGPAASASAGTTPSGSQSGLADSSGGLRRRQDRNSGLPVDRRHRHHPRRRSRRRGRNRHGDVHLGRGAHQQPRDRRRDDRHRARGHVRPHLHGRRRRLRRHRRRRGLAPAGSFGADPDHDRNVTSGADRTASRRDRERRSGRGAPRPRLPGSCRRRTRRSPRATRGRTPRPCTA